VKFTNEERRCRTNYRIPALREQRADGVSPMSVPGVCGGMYQTIGLEHDEQGRPNSMLARCMKR